MADIKYGGYEAKDIIKCGYMMIKRPPTSGKVRIKAWHTKFFVLRAVTLNIPQRLEYYKDESALDLQKSPEHCFFLDSVVYVGEHRNSKSQNHAIMVVSSKQGALILACDSEGESKEWIQAMNSVAVKVNSDGSLLDVWMQSSVDDSPATTPEVTRHNSQEQVPQRKPTITSRKISGTGTKPGYFVTTRLTPHSERNNIRGDYVLCFTEGDLVLQSVETNLPVVTWPVSHLRSFKSESAVSAVNKDMQLLTLNAGSRSTTGEGIFQFFTKDGDAIADQIRLRSQQMAARKRAAFRTRSSSGSDVISTVTAQPVKKLQRGLTAPPKKPVVVAKEESVNRSCTDTLNSSGQPTQAKDILDGKVNGSVSESLSSNQLRPLSATDSSAEKSGDDEVFLAKSAYSELDNDQSNLSEESDISAYIDLVSDESAKPIHISDPVQPRKFSSGSQASSTSFTSDEGSTCAGSMTRNFSAAELIPEENETDAEGYIRCEALESCPEENTFERKGQKEESFVSGIFSEDSEMSCRLGGNLPICAVDESLHLATSESRINMKTREALLAQIREPGFGSFPTKQGVEKESRLEEEHVLPQAGGTHREEGGCTDDHVDSLLEKARDPKFSTDLLKQIIAQMEKPQQHDVSQLFPAATRKRNSIGTLSVETAREIKKNTSRHSVIEKRVSACDASFLSRGLSTGPPVPPNRQPDLTKRRGYFSVGDLSEDLPKRPDSTSSHRSSFFAKGMGNVNPHALSLTPLRTSIAGHLGGEAAIHARLIEKTEIRDELAHSSAVRGKSAGDDTLSCSIGNARATCAVADETILNPIDSRDCRVNSAENIDEDGQVEVSKRKDSIACKIVKKVFKRAPKARRASNAEIRESYEQSSPPLERARRESLSPGDALELQRRLSGSETNSPDSSPNMGRKSPKSSPTVLQKISSDEKGKREKRFSPSTRLRKIGKGDLMKEELTKKEFVTVDTPAELASSYEPAASHETSRKVSTDEKSEDSHESRMTDSSHHDNGQSGDSPDVRESVGDSAPSLPPRKKSGAPPLPPRLSKSSSHNSVSSPTQSALSHHGGRVPQPRHSGTGTRLSGAGLKEDFLPPPPVPPRNSPSPEIMKMSNERTPARAPVIQLTRSSPENRDEASRKPNPDSEECTINATSGESQDQNPPVITAAPQSPESMSHPVPRRPPKEQRSIQAKVYFRNHANQHVISSDSEGGEMEDDDEPAGSHRYGNIDVLKEASQGGEEATSSNEEHAPSGDAALLASDCVDSNYIKSRVKSHKKAPRQKTDLMQDASVDKDIPFGGNSTDDEECINPARRPHTPLNIKTNAWTLSSVGIN